MIFAGGGASLAALKRATSTTPIVMADSSDPVRDGFVQSLGHPGGNFTGMTLQSTETTGKRLELLKELVPGSALVAVLWDRSSLPSWQAAEAAARERGWKLLSIEIRDAGELEGVFKAAADARAGALLVSAPAVVAPHARRVAELAARSRLPTMHNARFYVEAGGLISYGADVNDTWRRAAVFVDKIFKGAKPVEQPTKFELVINRASRES